MPQFCCGIFVINIVFNLGRLTHFSHLLAGKASCTIKILHILINIILTVLHSEITFMNIDIFHFCLKLKQQSWSENTTGSYIIFIDKSLGSLYLGYTYMSDGRRRKVFDSECNFCINNALLFRESISHFSSWVIYFFVWFIEPTTGSWMRRMIQNLLSHYIIVVANEITETLTSQ